MKRRPRIDRYHYYKAAGRAGRFGGGGGRGGTARFCGGFVSAARKAERKESGEEQGGFHGVEWNS